MTSWYSTTTGLVLIVSLAAPLLSCGQRGEAGKEAAKPSAAAPAPPLTLTAEEIKQAGITVEALEAQTVNEPVTLTGTLVPNQNRIAKVSPRLPGRIASVGVVPGSAVKPGQVLAVLESIELGEARSAYLQAKSESTVTKAALARVEKLAAEDIVPRKDYLRSKADAERAQAALRAAADKLKLLGVPPGSNEKQADAGYPLVAPFAGTIIEKKAVAGELALPDQALFTVADLSNVWLEADVFEKDLAKLLLGTPAHIMVTAYADKVFDGKLTYLGDTMDPTTRTVKARIEAPNPDRRLKPGMFASVQLQSTATAKALLLPKEAVLLVQGQPTVFVPSSGGFAPRAVETGPVIAGKVAVKSGLLPGDRAVVSGAYALKARLLKSQISTED